MTDVLGGGSQPPWVVVRNALFSGVKQVLAASATLPLAEIANRIVAGARAHGIQFDDQTLLLIRRG